MTGLLRTLWLWARGLCIALGFLMLLATFTPLVRWWTGALTGPWPSPDGDTLIVLGGNSTVGGLLGVSSLLRTAYAVETWREHGGYQRAVVSGRGVAPSMRTYLVYGGVPPDRIAVENEADTTHDNAVNCAKLLAGSAHTIVLLSSDYHMWRAARTFRKAGLPVVPCPIPDGGKRYNNLRERWVVFLDLVNETGKIVYYKARGWI